MDLLDFSGQTLDGKYHIERELGRGGMGTVYLANHLGTERPVAVKIISPQYMQRAEFVERFRREARAAGRLRHPNVVNVTDFGFADTNEGQVAYLVMEYLDGCTLGEILDEEKNLPVSWTLDILEQVCSAVQEAHHQGIIHRDLKPDNIWLEPNQRGGYTVKVLDFGIAKLEEHDIIQPGADFPDAFKTSTPTFAPSAKTTFGGLDTDATGIDSVSDTGISQAATIARTIELDTFASEAGTIHLHPVDAEGKTAIFDDGDISAEYQDTIGTRIISETGKGGNSASAVATRARSLDESPNSAELTRVGAVLGTPLYMSPEQCRGERLDQRSDIYSLAVIAYQMLSGRPPFEGDFKDVMEAHKSLEPDPLKAKKVRRKMKRAIHQALSKEADGRPQTAEAFANELRSRSEGIFGLLSRALVIYSEHLPKFLILTTFLFIPSSIITLVILVVSFLKVSEMLSSATSNVLIGVLGIGLTLANAFCGSLILGTISWIVTQYLAIPLRPLRLRPVLFEARKKWKRFAGAGAITAMLPFLFWGLGAAIGFLALAAVLGILYPLTGSVGAIFVAGAVGGFIVGAVGFFGAYITWMLVSPVVMMENVGIREALRRSRTLVKRSFMTAAAAAFIMFMIPAISAGSISFIVNIAQRAFDPKPPSPVAEKVQDQLDVPIVSEIQPSAPVEEKKSDFNWSFNRRNAALTGDDKKDMRTRIQDTFYESLIQIFWLPMQILVFSFSGIIVALLYLKTRLAGGESMDDLIERFEDDGRPRKKWQERVRAPPHSVWTYIEQSEQMTFWAKKFFIAGGLILAMWQTMSTQDVRRTIDAADGSVIEIVNKNGRVGVKTAASGFGLTASSAKGVADSEIKTSREGSRTVITITADRQKRIDLTLVLPERTNLKIETLSGAIEADGNFASIEAKTDTGTIAVDIPADDVRYLFQWTESRPRFLADFELAPVKERTAGRFEIRGRRSGEVKSQKSKVKIDELDSESETRAEDQKTKTVSLNLSTARGIILLNVPPNEVMSDLRERPLTNAAKSIVRSGDSLLMEAIRRASPKYFGEYARNLPPIRLEPTFAAKSGRIDGPNAEMQTALVRVTDLKNRAIPGLTAGDFEVLENGSSSAIVTVERSEAPFNLVLLLDVSGSIENYVNFIRKAARNFVDTVGEKDRVAIVIFNEDIKLLSTFTTDKGKLSTSLDTFDAGGGTAYYDALAYTIADTLRPLKGERTAIVILTDGDDNRSFLAFDSLSGSIQESGALVYPLYVPSGLIALAAQNMNADIDPLRKKYMSLTAKSEGEGEKLAQISGGVYYPITQIGQIQKAYEDIVLQMRSVYNVTFRSNREPAGNGASPKLKIKVKRENVFATISSVTAAK